MKQQFIIVIIFSLFTFANCKKENNEPEGNYFGYAKADINGVTTNYNKIRGGYYNNDTSRVGVILELWNGLIFKEEINFGQYLNL